MSKLHPIFLGSTIVIQTNFIYLQWAVGNLWLAIFFTKKPSSQRGLHQVHWCIPHKRSYIESNARYNQFVYLLIYHRQWCWRRCHFNQNFNTKIPTTVYSTVLVRSLTRQNPYFLRRKFQWSTLTTTIPLTRFSFDDKLQPIHLAFTDPNVGGKDRTESNFLL